MKKSIYLEVQRHQHVFWLGVLLGAVVIALIFFYRILLPDQYKSDVVNPGKTTIEQTKKPGSSKILPSLNKKAKSLKKVKSKSLNTTKSKGGSNAFPTPQGGYSAFPTPQGGYSAMPTSQDESRDFPTPQGGLNNFPTPQGG